MPSKRNIDNSERKRSSGKDEEGTPRVQEEFEQQVPLSASHKQEKSKVGGRFSALKHHHDMDDKEIYDLLNNSNNDSAQHFGEEEEEWLTENSDDNSDDWEDCSDDGRGSRSSAYSSSRYTTGTSSYDDDYDEEDYDSEGMDDDDGGSGDDMWEQPPPYDENELYAGDIVKVKKSCLRDFVDLAQLPPDVRSWLYNRDNLHSEVVKGVIRNVDDECITLDLIRPWSLNNQEADTLKEPKKKKKKPAKNKKQKKAVKRSSAWVSDEDASDDEETSTQEEAPQNFFYTCQINRADEILLDLVKRVFPCEVGDVVRSRARLDGGIAAKIYCNLSVSPSPLHTKGLGLSLPQPKPLPESLPETEQKKDLDSEDGIEVMSSNRKNGRKPFRLLSVREGGSKRGGKKGGKKAVEKGTDEAPRFWSDSSAFLPLLPFVQNAFVQSSKDPSFRGFVEEVYGEVLLRFADGSIAITHGYSRPLVVERGDFMLPGTMTGEFEMEDNPFELEYLLGQPNRDTHYEASTLFVFPRKIVLNTEKKDLDKEDRVLHLAPPADGAVHTTGDAQFDPDTDLGHRPWIFNSFQCTGFQLGGLCFSLAMAARKDTLPVEEEKKDALPTEQEILPGFPEASSAVSTMAASMMKSRSIFGPSSQTEQLDSIQNSRQSILSVQQTSSFYERLWNSLPSTRDKYKDFIQDVFLPHYAPLIVQVRDISTQYNVLWQDGTQKTYEGTKCDQFAPSRRNDFPEEEIQGEYLEHFTTDLVIPQRALHTRLEQTAVQFTNNDHPANPQSGTTRIIHLSEEVMKHSPPPPPSSSPSTSCAASAPAQQAAQFKGTLLEPIMKGKCSSYDTHLFYPLLETDVVCQDIVERRADDDCYLLEGLTPSDDPQFIGVLTKKLTPYTGYDVPKVFDHEEAFSVEWFKQRPDTLRRLLMKDGKQRGSTKEGTVVEGLDEATAGLGGDAPVGIGGGPIGDEALVEFTEADARAAIDKLQDPNDILLRVKGQDVGEVVGLLPDTRLRVQWLDGSQSICFRHEVSVIRVPEADNGSDSDLFESDDEDDQVTDSAGATITTEQSATADQSPTANQASSTEGSRAGGLGAAALVRGVTRSVGALGAAFGWLAGKKKTEEKSDQGDEESAPLDGNEDSRHEDTEHVSSTTTGGGEDDPTITDPVKAAEVFQVCPLFSAHLLAATKVAEALPQSPTNAAAASSSSLDSFKPLNPKQFMRQIKKEWTALKSGLPSASGVSCKVSETSTHLLKFAVEGPKHTPYYQGFFCFDVALPMDYPTAPPKVKFHSKGLKINPNLYADGNVCLSLLGTWNGNGNATEEWQPDHSTVLQVVLSLQALVLVKEPFYNEAGFESKKGELSARNQSKQYNEKCYLGRLDHLMSMASSPSATPPDFVFEFRAHYLNVVPQILARAKKYLADGESSSKSKDKKKSNNSSGPDGAINSDGLVLPISTAFLSSLETSVECLESQYNELRPLWEKEAEAFALPDLDSEDED